MKALLELAGRLLSAKNHRETRQIIVEEAKKFFLIDRVCLIIKNIRQELVVKAGLPFEDHGIDTRITSVTGEEFLRQVLRNRIPLLIDKPQTDTRVSYMHDLIKKYHISAVLFLPLVYKKEGMGLLVFDFVNKKILIGDFLIIKDFSTLASIAIGTGYERKKEKEELLKKERLIILGENSASVAHIIRNGLFKVCGFGRRILKAPSPESKDEYAKIVISMTERVMRTLQDVLTFSKHKKVYLKQFNLNQFLKEEVKRFNATNKDVVFGFKGDKRLDRVNAYFDPDLISFCLDDIFRNAVQFSAKKVFVKGKLKPTEGIVILISNDGEKIQPGIIKEIFSPFMTTRSDGTGLGLANVESIIKAHNGNIVVYSNDIKTEFRITLPLTLFRPCI